MKSSGCPTFSEHKRQAKNFIQNHNRQAFAQAHRGHAQAQGNQFFSSVKSYRDAAMGNPSTTAIGPMASRTQGPQESSGNPVGPGPSAARPPDIADEFAEDEEFPSLPGREQNQNRGENAGKAGETWSDQVERAEIVKAIPPTQEVPLPNSRIEEALRTLTEKVDKLGENLTTVKQELSTLAADVRNADEGRQTPVTLEEQFEEMQRQIQGNAANQETQKMESAERYENLSNRQKENSLELCGTIKRVESTLRAEN